MRFSEFRNPKTPKLQKPKYEKTVIFDKYWDFGRFEETALVM